MAIKLNPVALNHARQLLDDGSYVINTEWGKNEPTPEEEERFLDQHGLEAYGLWYLGVDTDEPADSKAHYKFPYGNFQKLHRSGVVAAKRRAEKEKDAEIVEGADTILDIFDRMNAC